MENNDPWVVNVEDNLLRLGFDIITIIMNYKINECRILDNILSSPIKVCQRGPYINI